MYVVIFFVMQSDVCINCFVSEYVIGFQEFVVQIQFVQCFFQRVCNLWDFFRFFWRQVIQVFVYGFVWMDFVFDIIKIGYQQGSKVQVWVSCRIWEMYFDMMCFRRRNYWNMDRCRMVMCRVSQYYRCFIVWDQMFIRVGGRVCQGVNRFSVFDYVVNVVQCLFRQICVFVVCEQVNVVFRQRYVVVYIGVVIIEYRFWYKGRGFIEVVCYVVYNIFVDLNFVSFFGYGIEVGSYFVLISSRYFVVMGFNYQVYLFYHQIYFRMNILSRVYRWNWEVIVFYCWMVIFVIIFILGGGVLCVFDIVDSNVRIGDR